MADMQYSIKLAAKKTGLSPHVIRIWERRYGAVRPTRTETNRRLYSEEEVERLALLHQAIKAGHSIGNIAGLEPLELRKLSADLVIQPEAKPAFSVEKLLQDALQSIRGLNTRALEGVLAQGSLALGQHGLLMKVIGPLAQRIGELWRDGNLMAAHEHFASAAIRNFLGRTFKPYTHDSGAPTIVIGTPSGQLHELGAVMVAAAAADVGWRVVYLGPSLPAAEIAGVVLQNRALALALSIVYPEDDASLPNELESLRRYLGGQVAILVGGRAAASYQKTLEEIGALQPRGFGEFYETLERLRKQPANNKETRPGAT